MQIRPASVDQVAAGRDGRRYQVTSDAGSVVKQLEEIDPRLFVEFIEPPTGTKLEGYYAIGMRDGDTEDLVLTVRAGDFNGRLVHYMRARNFELRHGISQADRMDAEDDARRRAADREMEERVGEGAGRLMRAIQHDILGVNPRVALYRPKSRAA